MLEYIRYKYRENTRRSIRGVTMRWLTAQDRYTHFQRPQLTTIHFYQNISGKI